MHAGGAPKETALGVGSHTWHGVPLPRFYVQEGADFFHKELELRDDDVVFSSLPKGGTTWVANILHLLLHGLDDEGKPTGAAAVKGYPEWLPLEPPSEERWMLGRESMRDLLEMRAPRLFTTHLWGPHLPKSLRHRGRLVVVVRNLKDVLSSLHFFNGEAKDGWLGNEHGVGSFYRFIDPASPNSYGNSFTWVREQQALVELLTPTGRVLVVQFEDLKADLLAEVARLAAFVGASLPSAKLDAVGAASSFQAMKEAGGPRNAVVLRKGEVGDWKNHLNRERWEAFDKAFEEQTGGVALAERLRPYQQW